MGRAPLPLIGSECPDLCQRRGLASGGEAIITNYFGKAFQMSAANKLVNVSLKTPTGWATGVISWVSLRLNRRIARAVVADGSLLRHSAPPLSSTTRKNWYSIEASSSRSISKLSALANRKRAASNGRQWTLLLFPRNQAKRRSRQSQQSKKGCCFVISHVAANVRRSFHNLALASTTCVDRQ